MTKSQSILVVIDAQNGFRNSYTEVAVPFIIAAVKAHDGPIIFTRFINKEGSNFERLLTYSDMKDGLAIELIMELVPFAAADLTFDKYGYSAFTSKRFCECLERLNVQQLELCGFDTDACVLATALDAFDIGYKPIILADACASKGGVNLHDTAINILQRNIGEASIKTKI